MGRGELLDRCQRAVRMARDLGADQAEAYAESIDKLVARAEKSDLQIFKGQMETAIGVRAFIGGQCGFASTNRLDQLDAVCRDAIALARISPEDPHNVLPEPQEIAPIASLRDEAALTLTAESAIEYAASMLREAEKMDGRLIVNVASFNSSLRDSAVANSLGIGAEQSDSSFIYGVVATARDGDRVSNYDEQVYATRYIREIDVLRPVRRACENALASLDAEKGESFVGSVILAPGAVADILVRAVLFQISATNALNGSTRWKDSIGEAVAVAELTLLDDGHLDGGYASCAFDREGSPRRQLPLIEGGMLRAHIHNAYSSHATGAANTVNASATAQSPTGIDTTNVIIAPGRQTSEALIADVEQGLLAQRFSGNVDPISGDFSGAVKAARLIRHGRLDRPVSGTMIAGNVFDILNHISGISSDREQILSQTLPFVRLENVSVSA